MQPTTSRIVLEATRVHELGLKRFLSSQELIERDNRYGAKHFKPLPVVLVKAEGVRMWDAEGKRYLDFLAGFSTVNQGHCHPRLVNVMREQAGKLTHTSRAFYSEPHGELGAYLCELMGWEKFLPMNTGTKPETTIGSPLARGVTLVLQVERHCCRRGGGRHRRQGGQTLGIHREEDTEGTSDGRLR